MLRQIDQSAFDVEPHVNRLVNVHDVPVILDASVDGQGGEIRNKPVFTAEEAAAYLNRGLAGWDGLARTPQSFHAETVKAGTLSFGFFNTLNDVALNGYVDFENLIAFGEYFEFAPFDPAQRAAAREAIASWDDVMAISIVERPAGQADINFGNLTQSPNTQAYAYLPYDFSEAYGEIYEPFERAAGDVWVSVSQPSNFQLDESFYGLNTLVHEVGHALGLDHPGDYNFGPGFDVNYENGAEYYQDSRQYSIMSYWDAEETGAQHVDWSTLTYAYGSTPGVHDVLAVQRMYGVDTTTRTGDTTYGFNSNAGRDAYDFVKTPAPVVTIWDAGGNDTLDLSGYDTPSVIDLAPGSFSSGGGSIEFLSLEEVNANRAAIGLAPRTQTSYDYYNSVLREGLENGLMKDNISIAYGAIIENAVGGIGDDRISGNDVANRLAGGDGLDRLTGGGGNDTFLFDDFVRTVSTKQGALAVDIIFDFDANGDDRIDLSALDANRLLSGDQAFKFVGPVALRNPGDLRVQTYGNTNAAENVLGLELDGLDRVQGTRSPTTIIWGNLDNDRDPEFAIVLLGNRGVDPSDFLF